MASRASHAMSGDHKKHKAGKHGKKPESIHVRRGKSGGYIAVHHFKPENGMQPESEEHVLPDKDAMLAHMADQMGDQSEAGTMPEDAGTTPGPAPDQSTMPLQ